jgi:paraquat-inducible protein B
VPKNEHSTEESGLPEAVAVRKSSWRVQLIWLVPIVAILVSGWIAVKTIMEQGPTITITFKTGEGLEAGKTKIKFKDVDIGVVKSVVLSNDVSRVVVTAEVSKDATKLLVDNTRFWVVRPRISGGTVSGLGTLLSGAYIGLDVGNAAKPRRSFLGLENPPVFSSEVPGREFLLTSENLGSLDVGTPVYFRRLQVGQISAYELNPDGKGVTLRAFINAPYDKFVLPGTRFWHASGIDVSVDTNGVKVDTQSLVSILIGGIAFETPNEAAVEPAAAAHTSFPLALNRSEAMKRRDRIVDKFVVNFGGSVRGLAVGAPVDFRGIVVGEVTGIYTSFDTKTKKFSIPVEMNLYPGRFTSRYMKNATGGRLSDDPKQMTEYLVESGLRVQLRTGNLISGQLYLALDFFPDAPKATVNWAQTPPELPSIASPLDSLQESVARLMTKLNGIKFDAIGANAQQTLQAANKLLARLDTEITPQASETLAAAHAALNSANSALQPESPLQQNTADAMKELARTASALRTLADYLERHPEAIIRGKGS